jgi:CRP/FNR family cyclic AMP-dependent transcriptional regulator
MVRAATGAVDSLIDVDPDLASGIDQADRELARRACRTAVVRVHRGRWEFPADTKSLLAFVVVEGVLCREVALRDRHMLELLGPGDVVQPPLGVVAPKLGGATTFTAIIDTALAVVDQQFIRVTARWPSLLTTLMRRVEAQRESLVIQGLIAHLPRAEQRVLLALWHLGDRWGRVTPEGMLLPLPLTHDLLGQMTAARRSTVTIAVNALEDLGQIQRTDGGSWLVTTAGEEIVEQITRPSNLSGALGETLMLRHWGEHAAASGGPP